MNKHDTKLSLDSISKFLDKLAENSSNVYWLSTPDLKNIEYISSAYETIWGRSRKELYKKPELWITYLHPDDAQDYNPIEAMAERIASEGELARYEENYRIVRPDGEVRWIIDRGFPIYNSDGVCCGITGVAIDISKEKQVEEQLLEAKEKAEAANELKHAFIQNMQHDIRTPLAGIYEYMRRYAEMETEPEKRKFAEHMAASAGQLLNMCNEIADFDNIEYLTEKVTLCVVETYRFFSRIIDLNKAAAYTRGIDLDITIDPNVPAFLKVDKIKISRVLVNLIGNSLKFTEKGSVMLNICCLKQESEFVQVAFEIKDTGIGIPADKIPLIFDKFVRVNPSNQAKYKGSGLGLYYVKKFVHDMDGELTVESTLNKGSVFRVVLTLSLPQAGEQPEYDANEIDTYRNVAVSDVETQLLPRSFNTVSALTPRPNQLTVLIIEDDPILQRMINQTMIEIGCWVAAMVDSVAMAKAAIAEQHYDLILSDLGLLDGNGVEVLIWVKQEKTHPNQNTPFIVLTANNDKHIRSQILAEGCLEVLQKPLTLSAAERIIKQYVISSSVATANNMETEIDWNTTLEVTGNPKTAAEILGMLYETLPRDKQHLEELYRDNNILVTREILHRLDGSLRYCIVPPLQKARTSLHEAIRTVKHLSEAETLYHAFYQAMDNFFVAYNQIKPTLKT